MTAATASHVVALDSVSVRDVARVGGKNASLGELLRHLSGAGVGVVGGFATEVAAYWAFIDANSLRPVIAGAMADYLARRAPLAEAGRRVRDAMLEGALPNPVAQDVVAAYRALGEARHEAEPAVAVRSSATAEDLPEASFAGQQETFLNVCGEAALLDAVRACFASLYTDRAIAYRENQGIEQLKVALSVGVQPMVRADRGCAGVVS
jgi:pyruvate,water dikinase